MAQFVLSTAFKAREDWPLRVDLVGALRIGGLKLGGLKLGGLGPAAHFAAGVMAVFLAGCGLDAGQQDDTAATITNPIVAATVNGRPIYIDDVRMRAIAICGLSRGQDVESDPEIFECALRSLIEERLFATEAERRGLDREPEVRRQLELARERVLADAIYRDLFVAASDPERVEAAFRNTQRDLGGRPRVALSQIVFETRGAALAALRRLQNEEPFEMLAMELSLDRSNAAAGGFLGSRYIEELPPAFRDLATSLEVGAVGGPIQSEDGWHLIRIDDRGQSEGQSLDAARPQIINVLLQQEVDDLYNALAENAVIETVTTENTSRAPTPDTPEPAAAPDEGADRPAPVGAGALASPAPGGAAAVAAPSAGEPIPGPATPAPATTPAPRPRPQTGPAAPPATPAPASTTTPSDTPISAGPTP